MLKTSLRYFMSVARHGSIRAASAELNIAQSAVSRRLQSLEYDLGMDLFERRPRGVVLTHAGEMLHAYCQNTTFEIDRLHSELDELRGLRRGRVSIATIESMIPSIMTNSIRTFLAEFPQVKISVESETSDRVITSVREGMVDIGLTFLVPSEHADGIGNDIRVVYSAREPLLAAMRPDHPLARKDSIDITDLANVSLALTVPKTVTRILFNQACAQAGITLQPTLETNSILMMLNFALAGVGVTLMLPHTAIDALSSGQLKVLPVNVASFSSTLSVITLRDRKLPLAAERFLESICSELRTMPFSREGST